MFGLIRRDTGGTILFGILGLAVVIVPVLNLLVPETSALHLSTYTVTLLGKYLTYALLAVALDLIWGYCGIMSLGHGAFFALGGYAMGMYLMRQIGSRGVYGHPVLPDFMVFLNWPELIAAIDEFILVNNRNPKPFVWTKKVEDILEKISHCKAIIETLH